MSDNENVIPQEVEGQTPAPETTPQPATEEKPVAEEVAKEMATAEEAAVVEAATEEKEEKQEEPKEAPAEAEAPKTEEASAEEAPKAEETPAEEAPKAEEKPAEEAPKAEEKPVEAEAPKAEEKPAEAPKTEEKPVEAETPKAEERPTPNYGAMSKEELLEAIRGIVAEQRLQAHKEVSLIKQLMSNIRQRETEEELQRFLDNGNEIAAFIAVPDPVENEFKELYVEFKEKRNAFLEAEENRRQENLARKLEVIEKMKTLMEDVDNINRNYPRFIELQGEFKEIKDIPPQAENEIWKQYKAQEENFYDLLKLNRELRDLDFKKNLEVKRQLIEQARQLAEEEDVIEAGRKLQILHNEWRETGPVAKEIREEIWTEFKEASTVVNKRHQEYFDQRRAHELEYEAEKTRICEQVEAIDKETLKSFAAWEKATDEIKAMQARWKELGPAPRKVNAAIFARFRKACDEFFAAKAEYYQNVKAEYKANLEKKEDIVRRAEEMLQKIDEKGSREAVQALQAEWRTVGPVERRHSDAIWQRFTAACNAFYDELRSRRSGRRDEENANLEAKKEIIEKIKAIPLDGERNEILPAIRELQIQWQQIGHVPYKMKEKIYLEYREACDAIYNSLDSNRTRERMNDYQERIRGLRSDSGAVTSERDKLVGALDRKKADLATYENNMGFFNVKSSAGNAMVQELERKIKKIKDEIQEIQDKIKMLDKQPEE